MPPSAPEAWRRDEACTRRIPVVSEHAGILTSGASFSSAARRHADRCCGESPWRRATSDTTAPGAKDSATIRALSSSLQRRRRTCPCSSEASTKIPTINATRSVQTGPMLQVRPPATMCGQMTAYVEPCDCGGLELTDDAGHGSVATSVVGSGSMRPDVGNASPSCLVEAQELPADRVVAHAPTAYLPDPHDSVSSLVNPTA